MLTQLYKTPFIKIFNSTLISLPAPVNISTMWNFGSILSMTLISQIITGLLLATIYSPGLNVSFDLLAKTMTTDDTTWFLRYLHANGASLFFWGLYFHIGRGIYYGSYTLTHTWMIGVSIFLLSMAAAFLGYVLPCNQMSFWGAAVITNLFSEIPKIGKAVVQLIWGGPSINTPTVQRFFTFHFIIPFIVLVLVAVHITFLHATGSNNPLGMKSNSNKSMFSPFYSSKDMVGVVLVMTMFLMICLYTPLILGDDENFNSADPMVTPHHIQPEWYFLFAYAILRAIPNKLGGVLALASAVLILYFLPFTYVMKKKSLSFYPVTKLLYWVFVMLVILLTWIGMRPVQDPYTVTGQILAMMYFMFYLLLPVSHKTWEFINKT